MLSNVMAVRLVLLTSLVETQSGSAVSGYMYAGVMAVCTFSEYTEALIGMVDAGWVMQRGDVVRLTRKGAKFARKMNRLIAEAKAKRAAQAATAGQV